MRDDETDFLDEIIEESTARNADFPQLMEQARRNRELLCTLATQRKRGKVSQTKVAAVMGTSQSAVSALEKTAADAKVSTIEKYAGALGYTVEYHLIPAQHAGSGPSVVIHD